MKKLALLLVLAVFTVSCVDNMASTPKSSSGVKKATADVQVGSNGLTTEQTNIKKRYKVDNEIGSIKHLYVISAFSGEVILYSTVDGKVTSGGKRLTPKTTGSDGDSFSSDSATRVKIGNQSLYTQEVIQDDGTYGNSMNYLYWFDVKGVYHQHYVSGGQIVHISTQAMPVKSITINLSE